MSGIRAATTSRATTGLVLGTNDGTKALRGGRCSVCGQVSVPPDLYGCPACGASAAAIETIAFSGGGSLIGFVTVWQKLHPERDPPFVIGSIRLREGPLIGAVMAAEEPELRIGAPVRAILVPNTGAESEGEWQFELGDPA